MGEDEDGDVSEFLRFLAILNSIFSFYLIGNKELVELQSDQKNSEPAGIFVT